MKAAERCGTTKWPLPGKIKLTLLKRLSKYQSNCSVFANIGKKKRGGGGGAGRTTCLAGQKVAWHKLNTD